MSSLSGFLVSFQNGLLPAGVAGLGEPKPDAAGCRL